MKVCVLGAGTWGTALAALLARNGESVVLWSKLPDEIDALMATHTHKNLPDFTVPENLGYAKDIKEALCGASVVLFVTPSQFIRSTARLAAPYIEAGATVISAAKGIEAETLKTMTEIIEDELSVRPGGGFKLVALSGPTHAEEVARGLPTSIVSACEDEEVSMAVARMFANSCMRVYTNTDVLGVEIAGAFKNIIALAAGINRGMGYGDNSQAMLITRGIAEITRIGLAMGCHRRTFMGLAGIGDLIVTCTSKHSRNNRCGELVGRGMSYPEAQREIGMVVEGYHALDAGLALAERYGVEMPITEAVYDVMKRGKTPKAAMSELMSRELKCEIE